MGRVNSCLFEAATIAKKPAWLRSQLAAAGLAVAPTRAAEPAPATTTLPNEPKPATRSRSASNSRSAQGPKPQRPVRQTSVEPHERETLYAGRVSVCITSYRRRLLDPDNLCAKWFLDACRYSQLIRDDRPEDITYTVTQTKVASTEEERTEIVITPLP